MPASRFPGPSPVAIDLLFLSCVDNDAMDPATASGLAIGVVSLAFDLFDNSVKREFDLLCLIGSPMTNKNDSFQVSLFHGGHAEGM